MARRNTSPMVRRITNTSGPRRNMNGAGAGGRLIANRNSKSKSLSQLGNRSQKRYDLNRAFGVVVG